MHYRWPVAINAIRWTVRKLARAGFAFRMILVDGRRFGSLARGYPVAMSQRRVRTALLLIVLCVGMGLLLTRCPANRDGMPGQLAKAMEATTGAARTGALALDQWTQRRSTAQLASVQLSDAREQVVKAYKGIADLRAQDPVDLDRQRMLTSSMTAIIGQLNAASGTVRGVTTQPSAAQSRSELIASADTLESGYR
jgi:hypothetical protein